MSLVLTKLKKIGNRYKLIVFGFIRNQQNQLSLSNIPTLITYLCLGYYYHATYFQKYSKNIKISNDKMTVTALKNMNGLKHACTNIWIESISKKIAKWKVKINSCRHLLIFRISSMENFKFTKPSYGFDNYGNTYTNDDNTWRDIMDINQDFKKGDIITIILNMENATMATEKNNNDLVLIFTGMVKRKDIKYRLAVDLAKKGNSVTLFDFELNDAETN